MTAESDRPVADDTSFGRTLADLAGLAEDLSKVLSDSKDFLNNLELQKARESVAAAKDESRGGRHVAAWAHLVEAAVGLGKLRGWADARAHFTAEQGVAERMRENGRKGGRAKGNKGDVMRAKVAKALIKAAPKGGWPTEVKFDLAYHRIAPTVPGFNHTEHQLRRIKERADIKERLRTKDVIRDEVVAALIKTAPTGGWPSMEGFVRGLDAAAEKVPDFRNTAHQRRKVMAHPDVAELLPPDVREST